MARQPIPTEVPLPYGYTVFVKQVGVRELRAVAECKDGEETPWALWDDSALQAGGTIWLLKRRKRKEKFEDFTHEMIHAVNDWAAWVMGKKA